VYKPVSKRVYTVVLFICSTQGTSMRYGLSN
jgi:hypothetical protein